MTESDEATTAHVRRARGGESTSIGWLVRRFSPWLLQQARYRVTGSLRRTCDPEDLVQATWAVVIARLPDIHATAGRSTPVFLRFLARTLTGHLLNLLRTDGRRRAIAGPREEEPATSLLADTQDVVEQAIGAEEARIVDEAVAQLPPLDREILILRGIEARGYDEIAAVLDVSTSSLRMRYLRARERLSAALPASLAEDLRDT